MTHHKPAFASFRPAREDRRGLSRRFSSVGRRGFGPSYSAQARCRRLEHTGGVLLEHERLPPHEDVQSGSQSFVPLVGTTNFSTLRSSGGQVSHRCAAGVRQPTTRQQERSTPCGALHANVSSKSTGHEIPPVQGFGEARLLLVRVSPQS